MFLCNRTETLKEEGKDFERYGEIRYKIKGNRKVWGKKETFMLFIVICTFRYPPPVIYFIKV